MMPDIYAGKRLSRGAPVRILVDGPSSTGRLACLDQARAAAILVMIMAHYLPGIAKRVTVVNRLWGILEVIARFATPAFVVVFGITAGFVFIARIRRGDRTETNRRLLRRFGVLLVCVVLVRLPDLAALVHAGNWHPLAWLQATYGVLWFFALAFLSLPLWLRVVVARPLLMGSGAGLMLWLVHSVLAFRLWPYCPQYPVLEILRLALISGDYGYLPLMGTALMVLPLGVAFRHALLRGDVGHLLLRLVFVGIVAMAAGLLYGNLLGDLTYTGLVNSELKAPARGWYYLIYGGAAGILLALLGILECHVALYRKLTYPFTLAGQCALLIYVGHFLVFPAMYILDWFIPTGSIDGRARLLLAAVLVVTLFVTLILRQHVKNTARQRAVWAVGTPALTS